MSKTVHLFKTGAETRRAYCGATDRGSSAAIVKNRAAEGDRVCKTCERIADARKIKVIITRTITQTQVVTGELAAMNLMEAANAQRPGLVDALLDQEGSHVVTREIVMHPRREPR